MSRVGVCLSVTLVLRFSERRSEIHSGIRHPCEDVVARAIQDPMNALKTIGDKGLANHLYNRNTPGHRGYVRPAHDTRVQGGKFPDHVRQAGRCFPVTTVFPMIAALMNASGVSIPPSIQRQCNSRILNRVVNVGCEEFQRSRNIALFVDIARGNAQDLDKEPSR